jgi:prophage regulatory protein
MFNNAYGGTNMATTILRLPAVKARTGLSRSTIYLRISEGLFPKPVSLGGRAVGWVETEITGWLNQQIKASRKSHQHGEADL